MERISELSKYFVPTRPWAQPTARQIAEGWIQALRSWEPVEAAEADAEDEFRAEELAAKWRESCGATDFLRGPSSGHLLPHWKAGAKYTKGMFLGYAEAVAERIKKPREYESFLHESVAILAESTYRKKLQPYDELVSEEGVGRAIVEFHEFVRTVVADDLGKLAHAAWRRHKERCLRKIAGNTGAADCATSKADPTAIQPATTATEPNVIQLQPPDATDAAENANGPAAQREVRLQELIHRRNTSVAAVCRAARVAKADMQHWRKGEMKSDSVMARRIEDVLSGKTPLPTDADSNEG